MRLAMISDTHFGDPKSKLAPIEGEHPQLGEEAYRRFLEVIEEEKLDYLVLLGDIIDQSITDYRTGFEAARLFFRRCYDDEVAETYVYVPGNHDFSLWTTVEYLVNVVKPLQNGRPGRNFRWSVPAIFDDRKEVYDPASVLPTVSLREGYEKGKEPPYGGLFLDYFAVPQGEEQNFIFAYPNAYLITNEAESVLLTHGHYFEWYWTLLGTLAPASFGHDLTDDTGKPITEDLVLKHLVALDFPQCQLLCSGVGQAGPLSDRVRKIQQMAKEKDLDPIGRYLNNLISNLHLAAKMKHWQKCALPAAANVLTPWAIRRLAKSKPARDNAAYLEDASTRSRFLRYFSSALKEIDWLNSDPQLNSKTELNIPYPTSVIFGHTHRPVEWGDARVRPIQDQKYTKGLEVKAYNCGGWLTRKENGQEVFSGATVFVYQTEHGFEKSRLIRTIR